MSKSTDIPMELKEFWKPFSSLAYRHNISQVFDDFLTIVLTQFVPHKLMDDWHADSVKRYDDKEKALINESFYLMLKIWCNKVKDNEDVWYDFFGDLYQAISSNYKASAMGQFFTPDDLCNAITYLLSDGNASDQLVNDPACGSGRLLLSFNAYNGNTNYYCAEDLDLVCCKMTAINMALHGMRGEVINHDSLGSPDTLRHGWAINSLSYYRVLNLPHIVPINEDQSRVIRIWRNRKKEVMQQGKTEEEATEVIIKEHKSQQGQQLNLF